MTFFSTSELTDFVQLQLTALPDTCTIATPVRPSDGGGSFTETTTTATSACRLDAVRGTEAGTDQIQERGAYRLILPQITSIGATSKITIGARTFLVRWTPPVTTYMTARVVGLEEVA